MLEVQSTFPGGVMKHLLSKQLSESCILNPHLRACSPLPLQQSLALFLVLVTERPHLLSPPLFLPLFYSLFPPSLLTAGSARALLPFHVFATAAVKRGPNGVNNDCSEFSRSAVRNWSNRGFVYNALSFFLSFLCHAWQVSRYYAEWSWNWIDETDSPLSFHSLLEVRLLHLVLRRDYHVNVCTCESRLRHTTAYSDNGAV